MPVDLVPIVERLRDVKARSVHIRNGLYLVESGALGFGDMLARLRKLVGDEELSALWSEGMMAGAGESRS